MRFEELDLRTRRSVDSILRGAIGSLDQGLQLALKTSRVLINEMAVGRGMPGRGMA